MNIEKDLRYYNYIIKRTLQFRTKETLTDDDREFIEWAVKKILETVNKEYKKDFKTYKDAMNYFIEMKGSEPDGNDKRVNQQVRK